MLKATFRGGDMIFRQGSDEFLVLMPDTTEEEAQPPLRRLLRAVEQWNAGNGKRYELSFAWAVAPYVTGSDVADVLRTVDRKMYQKKHNLVPVF
jgi:diguanylate cyclase (GGDEF)-like protein